MTVKMILLLLVITWGGSFASICLKRASGGNGIFGLLKDKFFWLGGILYGSAALLNILALRFIDFSLFMPLTSFTYIWTMLISAVFLKEKLSFRKLVGVLGIVVGAILITIG